MRPSKIQDQTLHRNADRWNVVPGNQLAGIVLGTKQVFEIKGLSFDSSAFQFSGQHRDEFHHGIFTLSMLCSPSPPICLLLLLSYYKCSIRFSISLLVSSSHLMTHPLKIHTHIILNEIQNDKTCSICVSLAYLET